jgi:AraC-like DNA-binding protein
MMPALLALPSTSRARARTIDALNRTIRHIEENYAERISLAELAAIAALSVFRFVTVFRREVGMSPHRFLCMVRVQRAKAHLRDGISPACAAIEVGFFDQSHLSRHFKSVCGMTPGQYLAHLRSGTEQRNDRPSRIGDTYLDDNHMGAYA